MNILIGNILLSFVLLFNLVGLNAVVPYVPPPVNVVPNTEPIRAEVPLELFHVEDTTLCAKRGRTSGRTFNSDLVRTIADTKYYKFFQYNVLGTDLQFVFERDAHRRLVDVVKLNGNRRPERMRSTLKTYVATINHIQFLVHKTPHGTIVGASPPPCQVASTEVENCTPRIEPEEPRHSHKRRKIVPPPTHI